MSQTPAAFVESRSQGFVRAGPKTIPGGVVRRCAAFAAWRPVFLPCWARICRMPSTGIQAASITLSVRGPR